MEEKGNKTERIKEDLFALPPSLSVAGESTILKIHEKFFCARNLRYFFEIGTAIAV